MTKIGENGLLSCNCRGWTVKKTGKPRECKHTKLVASQQGLVLAERDGQMFVQGRVDSYSYSEDRLTATMRPSLAISGASRAEPSLPPMSGEQILAGWQKVRDDLTPDPVEAPKPAGFVQPMLASKMAAGMDADSFSADDFVMEEKFDGHRILTRVAAGGVVSAWSRLANARTLPDQIKAAMSTMPIGLYDGELLVRGGHSYSVAAGENAGTEVYALFDALEILGQVVMNEPLVQRRELLAMAHGTVKDECVFLAEQFVPKVERVKAIWDRGGEGAIIKRLTSLYRPGWRSPDWVKIKAVEAATMTLTGWKSGESGEYSAMRLKGDDGSETTVKTPDASVMREIMAGSVVEGRRIVISFQERTPAGNYRHPMFDHFAGEAE